MFYDPSLSSFAIDRTIALWFTEASTFSAHSHDFTSRKSLLQMPTRECFGFRPGPVSTAETVHLPSSLRYRQLNCGRIYILMRSPTVRVDLHSWNRDGHHFVRTSHVLTGAGLDLSGAFIRMRQEHALAVSEKLLRRTMRGYASR